jgi:hypothetical protein
VPKTLIGYGLLCVVVCATAIRGECQVQSESDKQAIIGLLNRLSRNENPGNLLDPTLADRERRQELQPFQRAYEIAVFPTGSIELAGNTARLHAHFTYHSATPTSHEEASGDTDLRFVVRDGRWYFADYRFLKRSAWEMVAVTACLFLAIGWTVGTLRKWRSLRRQRTPPLKASDAVVDYFRSINPIHWFKENQ